MSLRLRRGQGVKAQAVLDQWGMGNSGPSCVLGVFESAQYLVENLPESHCPAHSPIAISTREVSSGVRVDLHQWIGLEGSPVPVGLDAALFGVYFALSLEEMLGSAPALEHR